MVHTRPSKTNGQQNNDAEDGHADLACKWGRDRGDRQQCRRHSRVSGSERTHGGRCGARSKQLRGSPWPALRTLTEQIKKAKSTAAGGAASAKPFGAHARLTGPPGRRTEGTSGSPDHVPGPQSSQKEQSKGRWRPRRWELTHTLRHPLPEHTAPPSTPDTDS